MTPIKFFLRHGAALYVVDHAGLAKLICVCSSEREAEWVGWSLGEAHRKSLEVFDGLAVPAQFDLPAPALSVPVDPSAVDRP